MAAFNLTLICEILDSIQFSERIYGAMKYSPIYDT